MAERKMKVNSMENLPGLFGQFDENIKWIQESFQVKIMARDGEITISGEEEGVEKAERLIDQLLGILERDAVLTEQQVKYAIDTVQSGSNVNLSSLNDEVVCVTARGKQIKAKTIGQKKYIKAMKDNLIVFGIGPAGTGKTYLAVAEAVAEYKAKKVTRIILTRPAVEAGERLGFLPGDLQSKVDPYLRPLYDALYEMLGVETYNNLKEKGVIEVVPLAYMRGRTLDDAFIILDEAQNTTPEQMKMFLTRMGFQSKIVVTGDITQIDLPMGKMSGLKKVQHILKGIQGIEFHYFSEKDVVRHSLVQKIIKAYDRYEKGEMD